MNEEYYEKMQEMANFFRKKELEAFNNLEIRAKDILLFNKYMLVTSLFTKFRLLKIRLLLLIFGIKISKKELKELIFKQTQKGLKKYGKTIIDCDYNDYNWNQMASEEIIDFYLYSLKKKKKI